MEALRVMAASAFFGHLGWHCWSRRHYCNPLLNLLCLFSHAPATPDEDARAMDEWAEKQMDEFRVQATQMLCEAMSFLAAVVMLVVFTSLSSFTEELWDGVAMMGVLLYPLCLAGRHDGPKQVTRLGASCIYVAIHAVTITCCHVAVSRDAVVYYGGNMRTMVRFCSAFIVMDVRLSTAVNATWSAVLILQHWSMPPELRGWCGLEWLAFEVSTLVGMQGFLLCAEAFMRAHFRLNTSMVIARSQQEAVRRLLSVLCDAEVQLSPSLEIFCPSWKAAQLLAPDRSCAELGSFLDFVASGDRQRFEAFLGAATKAPLQLQDSTGFAFAAEIFQARLPGLSRQGHLIGIRECGSGRESSAAAVPRGPTFGPGCPEPPVPRDGGSSSACSRAQDLPELKVELRFDPLHRDMPIREVRCSFASDGEAPQLCSWFHEAFRQRLRDWVQENCNTFFVAEEDSRTDFGSAAVLQLPPRGDPTMLEASEMAIDFLPQEGSSGSEGECAEGEEVLAVIEMGGFRQLLNGKRSRPRSRRSKASGRSRRSAPLASIREGGVHLSRRP